MKGEALKRESLDGELMLGVPTGMAALLSRLEANCIGLQHRKQRWRLSHFAHGRKVTARAVKFAQR